jgi:hypothetical protein
MPICRTEGQEVQGKPLQKLLKNWYIYSWHSELIPCCHSRQLVKTCVISTEMNERTTLRNELDGLERK